MCPEVRLSKKPEVSNEAFLCVSLCPTAEFQIYCT